MLSLVLPLLLAVRVPTPTLTASGTYPSPLTVTVTSRAAGETVYCASNSQPKRSASQRVVLNSAGTASWQITESQTLKCQAFARDNRSPSRIASATYTITSNLPGSPASGWASVCAGGDPVGHPEYLEPTRTLVNNIPTVIYACNCDATYKDSHCDDTGASDANTGASNSKATPIKSWSAIMSAWRGLRAGDTLALCKGGAWLAEGGGAWTNTNCTAGSPCTFREYTPAWADGTENRPRLVQTGSGSTWMVSLWGSDDGTTTRLAGYRYLNLRWYRPDHAATAASANSVAVRQGNSVSNVEICNVEIDGFGTAFYTEGTRAALGQPAVACDNAHWRIRGNRILNSCSFAQEGGGTDWEWDDNYFDNNGHALCGSYNGSAGGAETHQFYIGGRGTPCPTCTPAQPGGCIVTNYRVINNEFRRPQLWRGDNTTSVVYCPTSGDTVCVPGVNDNQWVVKSGTWYAAPGYAKGSALSVGSRNSDGVLWENNTLDWTPCHPYYAGIAFIGGNVDIPDGAVRNPTIRRNRITQCKGKVLSVDSANQLVFEDNLVIGTVAMNDYLIYAPQGTGLNAPSTVIRNNTFYMTAGGTFPVINTTGWNSVSGNIVTGNSITFAGAQGAGCFQLANPSLMSFMDNNQCSNTRYFARNSTTEYSLTGWQTYTAGLGKGVNGLGFDQFSTTTAPTFVSAPTDLTPASNDTALLNKGSTRTDCAVQGTSQACSSGAAIGSSTWSSADVATARDAAPDIGAIERPTVTAWSTACAAEPEPTTNVIYFCDCQTGAEAGCQPGNDAATVNSKNTPYRSWTKIQQTWRSLPAGGTIALCKGGRWAASTNDLGVYATWRNTNCTAGQPCTVRDYQALWGGSGRPTLVSNATTEMFAFHPPDNNTTLGHYRILNLRMLNPDAGSTLSSKDSIAVRGTDHTVDVELCNNEIDGFGIALYPGSLTVGIANSCTTSGWKIRGNRILNSCANAMYGNLSNSDFDGNYMDNNGHATCGSTVGSYGGGSAYWPLCYQNGGTTHTIYMNGEDRCSMDNVNFVNNEVHRNAMTDVAGYCADPANPVFTSVYYSQGGSALKFIAGGNNFRIENNLIDAYPSHPYMGYTAISTGDQGSQSAHFTALTARGNRVVNGGPHTTIKFKDASTLLVENNTLDLTSTSTAGAQLDEPVINISFESYHTATQPVVRNNTIYITGPTGADGKGIGVSSTVASGGAVTGNSVTINGTNTQSSCYQIDDPSKLSFMDNNHCGGVAYFAITQNTRRSLGDWRTYVSSLNLGRSFDLNSNTMSAQFVNAPTDLTPASSDTALIGNASTLSLCSILGVANQSCTSPVAIDSPTWSSTATAKPRVGSPFDIGAMERESASTFGFTVPANHPRLWWTPARVSQARTWYASNPFSTPSGEGDEQFYQAWKHVVTGSDCSAAITWALNTTVPCYTPESIGCDTARWYGKDAMVVYDWCNDQMTAQQKANFLENIASSGLGWNDYLTGINQQSWGAAEMVQSNYNWGNMANDLYLGISSLYENPYYAPGFLIDGLSTRWGTFVTSIPVCQEGGVGHEGAAYGTAILPDSVIWQSVTDGGRDLYNETPFFKQVAYNIIYATTMAPTYHQPSGVTSYQVQTFADDEHLPTGGTIHIRSYYQDWMRRASNIWSSIPVGQYARQWVNTVGAHAESLGSTPFVLAHDAATPATPFTSLALDFHAKAVNYIYGRTAWSPSSTQFFWQYGSAPFSCNSSGHEHHDVGNFHIWRNGRWLTRETAGYVDNITPYAGSAESCSTGPLSSGCSNGVVGHNMVVWGAPLAAAVPGWRPRNPTAASGPPVLLRLESTAAYTYAATNLTPQYLWSSDYDSQHNTGAVVYVGRESVYLRNLETTVMLDRLTTGTPNSISEDYGKTAAQVTTTFLLHAEKSATVTEEDTSKFTITNGTQVLRVTSLVPAAPTRRIVDETTCIGCSSSIGQYRIELDNSGNAQRYFLTVMQARDTSGSNITASVVDSSPGTPTSGTFTVTLQPSVGQATIIVFNKGQTSSGGTVNVAGAGAVSLRTNVQPVSYTDSGPVWGL